MAQHDLLERLKTPEFEVLLRCARSRHGGDPVGLRAAAKAGVDWTRVLALGSRHKLTPLLHLHLDGLGEDVLPQGVRGVLHRSFLVNAGWQLRFSGELLEILALFRANDILAVAYKGPVLAMQLYGDVALRECNDLDIVVRRQDSTRARELLLERGYRARHPLTDADRAFMLRSRYAEIFDGPDRLQVELHWAFTNGDVSFPLTLEEMLPRLEQVMLGGANVWTFSREDLLLVLCVHGAKHLWSRLEWVSGIAELASRPETIGWDDVLQRARDYGSERTLLLGLSLAHELLDAPVPKDILRRARHDRQVAILIGDVQWLLAEEEVITESAERYGSLHHDLFHFRLRERLPDQLRFLFYRFTTPSRPQRWLALPVGERSLPLHSLVRPIRVMAKLIPAVWWYATRKRARDLPSPAVSAKRGGGL